MSSRSARRRPPALPRGFLYRALDSDEGFIIRSRGELDGLVLSLRSQALPAGGRLFDVVRTMRIPFVADPDTAVLVEVTPENPRAAWLAAMPAGALVQNPPLTPEQLMDDASCEVFNRAVLSAQGGASVLSAAYFRVGALDDPWRAVNRRLLAAALATAAGRPVSAWLEAPLGAVQDGLVLELAGDYADVEYITLRVAGFKPHAATVDEAVAVLGAVRVLVEAGLRVILDCVGSYGAAALPLGAWAFTSGGSHHRSVPKVRVHRGQPTTKPLGYEVPLEWRELAIDQALDMAAAGRLGRCVVVGCDALDPRLSKRTRPRRLREHFVHAVKANASFARNRPAAEVIAELLASPDPVAQAWGAALTRLAEADSVRIHSPR